MTSPPLFYSKTRTMKNFKTKVLLGNAIALVASLVFIFTSAAQPIRQSQRILIENNPTQLLGVIDPRDVIALSNSTWSGAPYVVPQGKAFVLIGLNTVTSSGAFYVDGVPWATAIQNSSFITIHEISPVMLVGEGRVIQAPSTGPTSDVPVVFGYLVDV